jgi:hypothetical protein
MLVSVEILVNAVGRVGVFWTVIVEPDDYPYIGSRALDRNR